MSIILEMCKVHKQFKTNAETLNILKSIDLQIHLGESIAVTGPSGSGKSTLLGLMAGLEKPSSGEIKFCDTSIQNWDENRLAAWRREDVGFIFQNFRLIKTLTALENVSLPLEILGQNSSIALKTAQQLLRDLGLENRLTHFPHQLSGGEQQRVAIARAYVHKPRLIFADEPTGSLDSSTAEKVMESLLEINSKTNTTLIIVTHDSHIAQKLQRNIELYGGKILV